MTMFVHSQVWLHLHRLCQRQSLLYTGMMLILSIQLIFMAGYLDVDNPLILSQIIGASPRPYVTEVRIPDVIFLV